MPATGFSRASRFGAGQGDDVGSWGLAWRELGDVAKGCSVSAGCWRAWRSQRSLQGLSEKVVKALELAQLENPSVVQIWHPSSALSRGIPLLQVSVICGGQVGGFVVKNPG